MAGVSISVSYAQQKGDSSGVLKKVIVAAPAKQNPFAKAIPEQSLNQKSLEQLPALSIGEAAKYFSGVLINDYGGIGGLKTISVRSLGGLNTGLLFDGISVADAQTGQIDLGKFSTSFVQTLQLDLANPLQLLLPARAYASASVLSIASNAFPIADFVHKKWQAGIRQGSFGYWQPFAGVYLPTGNKCVFSANAEAIKANGNYPYYIQNGTLSQVANRSNSDIQSLSGELNLVKQFADSSTLQTKLWGYGSQRGLPGSVIFYNNISVQRLWDRDLFLQGRYQKNLAKRTALLASAKYSNTYTRYRDPNFPNNAGGLDDRYKQNELYASLAVDHHFGSYFSMALASDFSNTKLTANIPDFANPSRSMLWNVITAQYIKPLWQLNASLLNTHARDKTEIAVSASDKNMFTPTLSASMRPSAQSPFQFRVFYKDIFRLPTFNDLYYTFIQNINAKLLPEYAKQYNIGLTYTKQFHSLLREMGFSIDGYYNTIKDKIVAVPGQNLFIWTMENLGKVQIKGLDINADCKGNFSEAVKWSMRLAYTLQQAVDITNPASAEYKNEIPYTPVNSGSGLALVNYKYWTAGYSLIFSGTRYTLGANNPANELDGWDTQDFFVSRLLPFHGFQTNIKAELDNMFNEHYQVIRYYPMPGRSYKISIVFNNL